MSFFFVHPLLGWVVIFWTISPNPTALYLFNLFLTLHPYYPGNEENPNRIKYQSLYFIQAYQLSFQLTFCFCVICYLAGLREQYLFGVVGWQQGWSRVTCWTQSFHILQQKCTMLHRGTTYR